MASVLEEKEAVRDLMSRYCFYIDNCEFDKFAALFTEDAQFEAGPLGKLTGRDAIREFIAAAVPKRGEGPARKHCTFNHVITIDGDEARADSYIVVLRESDGGNGVMAALAGRYEDMIVKRDGQWRFRLRKIHFDITGDLGLKKR
ncbi:MAG: nuclear transport factor 2 family protein [Candidatus Binataceae bacterium]